MSLFDDADDQQECKYAAAAQSIHWLSQSLQDKWV